MRRYSRSSQDLALAFSAQAGVTPPRGKPARSYPHCPQTTRNRPNTATRSSRRFAIVGGVVSGAFRHAQTGPDPSQAPRTQVGAYFLAEEMCGSGMALDLENYESFSAAIEGLPKVVELIARSPRGRMFGCIGRRSAKLSADCASARL
jgi:hypothetical protein